MAMSRNVKGALFMMVSMAGFVANDALIKAVSGDMNVGQMMLVRGILTTGLVFLIARQMGALRPIRVIFQPMILARIIFEVLAAIVYLEALGTMPLSNIQAILQALPLAVTLGAALFFKEPIGWRRWVAILAGFCGVMIIVRPDAHGFTTDAVLAISCVFLAAGRDLVTKKINSDVPSLMVTTVTALSVAIVGGLIMGPMGGWRPMSLPVFLHLVAASVLIFAGYHFIIMAMRTGEISFIAPFRYSGLLVAIILGGLIFGERPDLPMMIGIVIVVASGLYAFHRERLRAREVALP